ncbi:hypothetical protein ACO0QE_002660 [Hanseniaspora vineae]
MSTQQETSLDLTHANKTCSDTNGNDYQLEMTLEKLLNQHTNEKDMDMDNDVLKGLDLPALLQEDEQDAFIHESMKYAFDEPDNYSATNDAFNMEDKNTQHDSTCTDNSSNNRGNLKTQRKQTNNNIHYNKNKLSNSKSANKDDLLFHTLTPPSSTNSPFPSDSDEFGKLGNISEITSNQLLDSTDKLNHTEELNRDDNDNDDDDDDDDAIEPSLKSNENSIEADNLRSASSKDQDSNNNNFEHNNTNTDYLDLEQKIILQLGGANRLDTEENEYHNNNNTAEVVNTEFKITDQQVLSHQLYKKLNSKLVKSQTENKDITNNYAILKDEYIKNCISLKKALLKLKEISIQEKTRASKTRASEARASKTIKFKNTNNKFQSLMGKRQVLNLDGSHKSDQLVTPVVAPVVTPVISEKNPTATVEENSSNEAKQQ